METELRCCHCDRYLGKAHGTIVATLMCSNSSCKGETQFKVVSADISKMLNYKFATAPKPPKPKNANS